MRPVAGASKMINSPDMHALIAEAEAEIRRQPWRIFRNRKIEKLMHEMLDLMATPLAV